jgi:acetyl esterase/lipase
MRVALVVVAIASTALHAAWAQSPREALRARRAQAPPPAAVTDPEAAGLEGAGAGAGKFALPPGARAERDVAYGSDPAQRLDLYIPAAASGAPIIVMVHGGAWMLGDKGNSGVVANKVRHWLPKGYIVASANYRMGRPPNAVQQAEDVGRALAFVQQRAGEWGGDGSRVVLMGHSSGAHLVTLLTASAGVAGRAGAKAWLGTVSLDSAAIAMCPPS